MKLSIPLQHNRFQKQPLLQLPQVLGWQKIYPLPTRYGLLFIILVSGMLIGSINYNNNLGFLLTFLLASMAFVSLLHTHKNIRGLRVISVKTYPVFAGDTAFFSFLVRAPQHARNNVVFSFENSKNACQDVLRPDADCWLSIPVKTATRGILKPGPLTIETRHPLGLFLASARLSIDLACIVYPKPIPFPHQLRQAMLANNHKGADNPFGIDDFQGLQAYQPGDPLRRISWKAYSRGHGLLTKVFMQHLEPDMILDWYAFQEPNIETKLSMLCHEILALHKQQRNYGLRLPDHTIPPGKSEAHMHHCLQALARYNNKFDTP